jgi:pyruvate kinase
LVRQIRKGVESNPRPFGIPILMDLKGPSIRTGFIHNKDKKIMLRKFEYLELTTDYSHLGTHKRIACSYPKLAASVNKDDLILVADGTLTLLVVDSKPHEGLVLTKIMNDFVLGESKNMNLPRKKIDLPTITAKDKRDLQGFARDHEIDMISVSFCRTANDIEYARELLGVKGNHIELIAKIENHEGIDNLEEIIRTADGIMIARGDLGMELKPEETALAQKMITYLTKKHCKPVIVATQMLESMVKNARPTRAEIGDVTNAVLDSNDAIMLSGETSVGAYPSAAVKVMRNVAQRVEGCKEYYADFQNRDFKVTNAKQAIIQSAVEMSMLLNSEFLIVLSKDSDDAKFASSMRPKSIILAPFNDQRMLRFFELFNGLYGVLDAKMDNHQESIRLAYEHAIKMNFISREDPFTSIVADCDNLKIYPFEVN